VALSTLPRLDSPYATPDAAIASFRRDGHVVVPSLASTEEVSAYRPVIDRATEQYRRDRRPLAERGTYGKAFIQTTNLWRHDPAIAGFTLAQRFARVAAELMGVGGVRLYHDQALYKEPGGGPTPWHQDQTYWPLDTDHTITMWMPFVDVPAGDGELRFVSGSHLERDLGTPGIGSHSQAYFDALISERGWPVARAGPMRAGDASFHAGWTIHGAFANATAQMRSVMTVIYYADGTRVLEPRHETQKLDLAAWLPGCAPGEMAVSHLNPLIYARDEVSQLR
jgi:ectoine hydroxylase-related dioxygenase (phytanoyl-CoA dioxygenase family)